MFGNRYYGRYFGDRYFPVNDNAPVGAGGDYFGNRYFALRYFGEAYYGPTTVVDVPPVVPVVVHDPDARRRWRPAVFRDKPREEEEPEKGKKHAKRAKKKVKKRITTASVEAALEGLKGLAVPDWGGIPDWWLPTPTVAEAFLPSLIVLPASSDEDDLILAIQQMIIDRFIEDEQDEEEVLMLLLAA